MIGILTLILGVVFAALVAKAILSTIIGLGKIGLGLILIGCGHIADGAKWVIRKARMIHFYLTVR
jgi:hypothetical protein